MSYSWTQNMASIIRKHNSKVMDIDSNNTQDRHTQLQEKRAILSRKQALFYNALVTTDDNTPAMNYIRLTEGTFKRYTQHKYSLQYKKHSNNTELSKYVWKLKNKIGILTHSHEMKLINDEGNIRVSESYIFPDPFGTRFEKRNSRDHAGN